MIPPLLQCEHPALPAALGAVGIVELLDILTSNRAVWEKTALIVSYDENGGFFDHVAPPTAPEGTPGEFVTVDVDHVDAAKGIRGPIGLGYRVPCLVISPYSRGGRVISHTYDHTSQLRLVERRFGVDVPNLTPWRRRTTGDMTATFDFARRTRPTLPSLVDPHPGAAAAMAECNTNIIAGSFGYGAPYPVPPNRMPRQEEIR